MGEGKERAGMTRRQFVAAAAVAGAGLAAGCTSERGRWAFLREDEARTLAALCDAIVPADEYPSGSQAGVVTYIDRQLIRAYARHQRAYVAGLLDADALSLSLCGVKLADATAEQRVRAARAVEQANRRFFELVRQHTMEGYYGSPRHGGNRDAVSWRMLGLDEPPVRGRGEAFSR